MAVIQRLFALRKGLLDMQENSRVKEPAMQPNDPPFTLLDEAAISAADLRRDPFDFCFVEHAIAETHKDDVLADAPVIATHGSYGLPNLRYGPRFDAAIEDLLNPRFRRLVEVKFDMDLSPYPPCIAIMGNTTGNCYEGYAHPD